MEAATGLLPKVHSGYMVDHLVFVVDAAVDLFQFEQLVEIEGGEAGALDAAEVAAGAFDPEDAAGRAVERINLIELGAGIATTEVGDAQIGAEQVRPVAQQLRRIQLRRHRLVPLVLEKLEIRVRCHDAGLPTPGGETAPTIIPHGRMGEQFGGDAAHRLGWSAFWM